MGCRSACIAVPDYRRTHAVLNGKYSPDIEDIRAVAYNILRHRIIKNYKAEAEGITIEQIIDKLLAAADSQ